MHMFTNIDYIEGMDSLKRPESDNLSREGGRNRYGYISQSIVLAFPSKAFALVLDRGPSS